MRMKFKKCRICKEKFYIFNTTQIVCSVQCGIKYANAEAKKKAIKKAKEERAKTRREKENLMTLDQWKKKLQIKFNEYIRIRDQNKGCVSCGITLIGKKYDAGHFYPTTYQGLRFNELNVHSQCVKCNRDLHGNIHEYRKRITNRITPDQLKWLDDNRHIRLNLNKIEIKELLENYRKKVSDAKRNRNYQ